MGQPRLTQLASLLGAERFSRAGSDSAHGTSSIAEGIGISIDGWCAAEMGVENLRLFGEITLLHEIDFSVAIDTMLQGPELLNLTVKDVAMVNGTIRAHQAKAAGPMRLVQADRKSTWKMDCRFPQKARRLYFPRPRWAASSSDVDPANARAADILGFRGRARPHTGDLETVRMLLGHEKIDPEVSTHRQKVRPDRNFSYKWKPRRLTGASAHITGAKLTVHFWRGSLGVTPVMSHIHTDVHVRM